MRSNSSIFVALLARVRYAHQPSQLPAARKKLGSGTVLGRCPLLCTNPSANRNTE
ncbi:hypothetical protein PR003_g2263 [Phytophthora rubi]|uniref:Uncharacterized protein n=1 Tax=Phytophthora rubi TaxID=129364 RepID=A0A6A3NZB5_9STRA|nr:hypothetical protein PR002_g2028 [Phytophthora rubi]KAE9050728.1 hypothetical protein PR001_g2101 [Phytophthora rubi]KAE9356533.1 hypothetical protein PR003_g2263 [Phytophthora rubi]